MKGRIWITLAGGFCAAAMAIAGTRALPPGALLVEPAQLAPWSGRAEADAARVLALLARGDAEGAHAALPPDADPLRREAAALRVVDRLQGSPAAAATERLLEWLAREPTRVFRRHDETAGDWFVPLFDVAARAEATLLGYRRLRERDALLRALQHADADAALAKSSPALQAAAIDALPAAALEATAKRALAGGLELSGRGWVALAHRVPRAETFAAARTHAAPADLLPLLGDAAQRLPEADAITWLDSLADDAELGSAAVLALGALASESTRAWTKLVARLDDARLGASVAAALASSRAPDRLQRIDDLLAKTVTPRALRNLALALRLEGSTAARERLHTLAEDPRLDAATKRELQR